MRLCSTLLLVYLGRSPFHVKTDSDTSFLLCSTRLAGRIATLLSLPPSIASAGMGHFPPLRSNLPRLPGLHRPSPFEEEVLLERPRSRTPPLLPPLSGTISPIDHDPWRSSSGGSLGVAAHPRLNRGRAIREDVRRTATWIAMENVRESWRTWRGKRWEGGRETHGRDVGSKRKKRRGERTSERKGGDLDNAEERWDEPKLANGRDCQSWKRGKRNRLRIVHVMTRMERRVLTIPSPIADTAASNQSSCFLGTAMEHASRRSSSSIAKTTCWAGSRRSLPSSCCPDKKSCVARAIGRNAGDGADVWTMPVAVKQSAIHERRKC